MTVWLASEAGTTEEAKKEVLGLFEEREGELPFDTPKPRRLIEKILHIATRKNSIVLDSFAGSGTTAHAVISQNYKDGGERKFVMVESEDYADKLTAERIRKAIAGYDFRGTKREELYRATLNYKRIDAILDRTRTIEASATGKYSSVDVQFEDSAVVITGIESSISHVPGLAGSFAYCTLGEPLDLDRMLVGQDLPAWPEVAAWLYHTATGGTVPPEGLHQGTGVDEWYVGESPTHHLWTVYRPSAEFLMSPDAALSLELARGIAESRNGKPHLVFAPYRFASPAQLRPFGVEYAALPFSLNRLERE